MRPSYFDVFIKGVFKGVIVVAFPKTIETEVAKVFGDSVTDYKVIEWEME